MTEVEEEEGDVEVESLDCDVVNDDSSAEVFETLSEGESVEVVLG